MQDVEAQVEKGRDHAGGTARDDGGGGGEEGVDPADDQDRADPRPQRKAAVDGQVRKVEHPEGQQDAEGHQPEDEADLDRAQELDIVHAAWLTGIPRAVASDKC